MNFYIFLKKDNITNTHIKLSKSSKIYIFLFQLKDVSSSWSFLSVKPNPVQLFKFVTRLDISPYTSLLCPLSAAMESEMNKFTSYLTFSI